jgi:hypothetical protein
MKYQNTFCSQCGKDQGPNNTGFSHCEDHSKENIMQDYTLTVISKTGDTHDYVVYAADLDAAIDKMMDKISYDVREIHTEDEIIIF